MLATEAGAIGLLGEAGRLHEAIHIEDHRLHGALGLLAMTPTTLSKVQQIPESTLVHEVVHHLDVGRGARS